MYQPILLKDLGKSGSSVVDRNALELNESNSGDDVGGDDRLPSDQVMDTQFTQLETNGIELTDITKYMDNLKEKHSIYETHSDRSNGARGGKSNRLGTVDTDSGSADDRETVSFAQKQQTTQSSEDESLHVAIDKRVDKLFRSEKKPSASHENKSISHSRSPERGNKSGGVSPVKIIKLSSPRIVKRKLSAEKSSRSNSKERQTSPCSRHVVDAGILKPSSAPTAGILKRTMSPASSFDRHQLSAQHSLCSLSPNSSFDGRSPEVLLVRGPSGAYQTYCVPQYHSVSPVHDRKRSLSAHSSFIRTDSYEPECRHQTVEYSRRESSPDYGRGKRLSKSLERSTAQPRNRSMYYSISPPRIYHADMPVRSQSLENSTIRNASANADIFPSRSNESLLRFHEYPTCVECLYQRKPS